MRCGVAWRAALKSEAWLTAPVATLSAEEVSSTHDEYTRNVFKMCKMYRDDKVIVKVCVARRRARGQSACMPARTAVKLGCLGP